VVVVVVVVGVVVVVAVAAAVGVVEVYWFMEVDKFWFSSKLTAYHLNFRK